MGLRKNTQRDDDEEKKPKFILKNKATRRVWHEQFNSRLEAQGKIDYERNVNGVDGGWEVEEV